MIEFKAVSKFYQDTIAVNDVSFKVNEGETLILLGTSGCGKTTTLKMINRLVESDQGIITFKGEDIRNLQPTELRRQIGYVIQHIGLFPHLSVFENIATVPRLLGWSKEKISERVYELMQMLGLDSSFAARSPVTLSGGQRQRVGLARAMAADPPLILLDEPFGALDPITREKIQKDFLSLESLLKKTMIMVTHDVKEAFALGQKIVLMDQGKVQQSGAPAELIFTPFNQFVKDFITPHRFQLELGLVKLGDLKPYLDHQAIFGSSIHTFFDQDSLGNVLNLAGQVRIVDQEGNGELITDQHHLLLAFNRWQKSKRDGISA